MPPCWFTGEKAIPRRFGEQFQQGIRAQAPHVNQTSRTNTIVNVLKQRAQAVLNDESLDAESRAILRYALETHDPWFARLVRRAEVVEDVVDNRQMADSEKISALAELICSAGDETSAALFVLMGILQNSTEPMALANIAKHLAFTRCGELNFGGMVEAQIAVLEKRTVGKTQTRLVIHFP